MGRYEMREGCKKWWRHGEVGGGEVAERGFEGGGGEGVHGEVAEEEGGERRV